MKIKDSPAVQYQGILGMSAGNHVFTSDVILIMKKYRLDISCPEPSE
jgi:hypothetical protein